MRISQRLYLTSLPAIVAVFLMAGLFYWGQYAHAAPELVLIGGAIAVIISGSLAWSNARYVARRIEGLATRATSPDTRQTPAHSNASVPSDGAPTLVPDEIDEIERVVFRLSSAVELAEMNRADREKLFERRAHDYALLLASVADASAKQIEEVRLPLHILLDNHFGELNENQEEMLGAARAAAEAVDADMLLLRQIAALDLGDRPMRRDRIKPADLIDALRPMLIAAAEPAGGTVEFDIAPLLPAVIGDRAMLHDAFVTLLRGAVESAPTDASMRIGADHHGDDIRFSIHGGGVAPLSVRWAAGVRVIQAHNGAVERDTNGLWIDLPVQPVVR
jgi:signal transduction histidine kinase